LIVVYIIAFIVLAFLAVILLRAFRFRPPVANICIGESPEFDREKAVNSLSEMIKCKTVSYYDSTLEDNAEFEKLLCLLPDLFPGVYRTCTLKEFDGRALLFHWKGTGNGEPTVLMAHYDVVPASDDWEKPPFEAVIEDGILWGRGTLDTKVTVNGILAAAETLIAQNFRPENDIYFAFSGGEEVNGPGAKNIVEYFYAKGITPALVLDEGGAVVENVFPGVTRPCAMIGIAEKGMINVEYLLPSSGGHAATPAPHTPVGKLALACAKVESHPFKKHFSKPVLEMFDTLGRHSTFLYRLIFANLWCFGWVLDMICKKSGGELNALLRTTVAFTQMNGSNAPNVIPPVASMVSNIRLNPMDSVDSAMDYLKKTIDSDEIRLKNLGSMEPSRISRTDCDGWNRVVNAVSSTWQGSIVSPYLMVQCSDSRHYGKISDRVYRFSAMDLSSEERSTIHGRNERIRLEVIERAVEFYIRLIKQC